MQDLSAYFFVFTTTGFYEDFDEMELKIYQRLDPCLGNCSCIALLIYILVHIRRDDDVRLNKN